MIHQEAKLVKNIFEKDKLEMTPTRNGYGKGMVRAGKENPKVVVLCADLTESTRSEYFQKEFPERFIEMGVAEQNMAVVASGLAAGGKIPFISSYAVFSPGRNFEQIRTTIALNYEPVKIGGAHAGISVGPDGATHQALEDIALMRVLPNMTVLVPCDAIEAEKATYEAAKTDGPVYIRFARAGTPVFTTQDTPFEIGKALAFFEPKNKDKVDCAIIACGPLVYNAILAAKELEDDGFSIAVINNHTIKPMDQEHIIKAAKKAGAIVTVEEHQINGGMGSAVAEILAKNYPVPMEFIGVQNRFGESGEPDELIEKFGMGVNSIKQAARKVVERKK
ncbi:MAG: transketolase C-terminal domain-containing protein [Patescibacteria group bacterium]